MVVGVFINTMKTTFLIKFWFIRSFFSKYKFTSKQENMLIVILFESLVGIRDLNRNSYSLYWYIRQRWCYTIFQKILLLKFLNNKHNTFIKRFQVKLHFMKWLSVSFNRNVCNYLLLELVYTILSFKMCLNTCITLFFKQKYFSGFW